MQTEPTPQFITAIAAAVEYWRRRTEELDDAAIARLDEERQNLYRAVEFGLKRPETWQAAAEVALQAFDLVERRGYWREWIPMLEAAVSHCGETQQSLKCHLLNRLGFFYRQDRQLDNAIATHQEAEGVAWACGDRQRLAETLYYLGGDYLEKGAHGEGERYGLAALATFADLENVEHWLAWTHNLLGIIAAERGDTAMAKTRLTEAVTRWRPLERPLPLARALNDLGNTLWPAGKVGEAEACFAEAFELLAPTNFELDKTMIQLNLGTLHFHQQWWDKADLAFRRADSPYLRRSGHIYFQAVAANNLGSVLCKRDRPVEAEHYLRRALELWQQVNDEVRLAYTLGTLGETLAAQGQVGAARALYDEAIEHLQRFSEDDWARRTREKFKLARRELETGDLS